MQQISAGSGLYGSDGNPYFSGGVFPSLLPYLEQKPLYDAINFSVNIFTAINATVSATGIATFWCPSDSGVGDAQSLPDGNFYDPGSFHDVLHQLCRQLRDLAHGLDAAVQRRLNGLFNADGRGPDGLGHGWDQQHDRLRRALAGGSGTGRSDLLSLVDIGLPDDTLFVTFYPMNPQKTTANASDFERRATCLAASSQHPGGCNFAFPGWLGPVPQGHDRLLEGRPGHRVSPRHFLRFDRPGPCRPGDAVPGLPGPLDPQRW